MDIKEIHQESCLDKNGGYFLLFYLLAKIQKIYLEELP